MSWQLLQGDVLAMLRTLPSESVQVCVTSPPYYGLRDYGLPLSVWGGRSDCAHEWGAPVRPAKYNWEERATEAAWDHGQQAARDQQRAHFCTRCDAFLGCLGLEPTPALFTEHLVEVFREVRRVLRKDGTLWLNLGDSYAGSGKGPSKSRNAGNPHSVGIHVHDGYFRRTSENIGGKRAPAGFKPKDLMLMPARVAIALQDDGWWVRSRITWCKRACMPESTTDRPTNATEDIYLLTKRDRYFYDGEAVREGVTGNAHARGDGVHPKSQPAGSGIRQNESFSAAVRELVSNRNMRNYWLLGHEPFPEAHFATFPSEIPRRAILAGTSAYGACSECGAPWRRVIEQVYHAGDWHPDPANKHAPGAVNGQRAGRQREPAHVPGAHPTKTDSTGWAPTRRSTDQWQPTCKHADAPVVPCAVLDPFAGSGTTLVVATELGRAAIGIELNPDYAAMAERRLARTQPGLAGLAV